MAEGEHHPRTLYDSGASGRHIAFVTTRDNGRFGAQRRARTTAVLAHVPRILWDEHPPMRTIARPEREHQHEIFFARTMHGAKVNAGQVATGVMSLSDPMDRACLSGSSPSLGHYFFFANEQRVSVRLRVCLGTLEVGVVDVKDGEPVHAELPGATGDRALELLARLRRVEISCERLPEVPVLDVRHPWTEAFGTVEAPDDSIAAHIRGQFAEATRPNLEVVHSKGSTATVDDAPLKQAIREIRALPGSVGAAIVDGDAGVVLHGGGDSADFEVAAAAMLDVLEGQRRGIGALGLDDAVESIVATLGTQYHLILPLDRRASIYCYVVLRRDEANLGVALQLLRTLPAQVGSIFNGGTPS